MHTQTVERFIAALQDKDLATISALLDDRMSVVNPLPASGDSVDAIRFEGKEASLGYFQGVTTRMGQIRFDDVEISVADGGRVVFVEANGDMTTAAGVPYRNIYVLKFELSGERIVRLVEYANPITFATTFGFPLGPGTGSPAPDPAATH